MGRARIIPILTIDRTKLVKTVKFKKPNYLGDPINAIKIFNDKMVDEIVVLDITCSKEGREPNYDLIYEMASECFSPLGYGGGIKSYDQAQRIFSLGVEKVIMNSAVLDNPALVTQIAKGFGSSSTVVSLDVKKTLLGKKKPAFISASKTINEDLVTNAKRLEDLGAGELIVHATDIDGTFKGMDREITKLIADAVSIPVIACGGAHSIQDMTETIASTGASAAAGGSVFVYKGQDTRSILISYPTPEDIITR